MKAPGRQTTDRRISWERLEIFNAESIVAEPVTVIQGRISSVQFCLVHRPIGSPGRHELRFNRDARPLCCSRWRPLLAVSAWEVRGEAEFVTSQV